MENQHKSKENVQKLIEHLRKASKYQKNNIQEPKEDLLQTLLRLAISHCEENQKDLGKRNKKSITNHKTRATTENQRKHVDNLIPT